MDDADSGEDFTADAVLELTGEEGNIAFDGTDAAGADTGSNILLDTVADSGGKIILEDVRVARLKNPEKNGKNARGKLRVEFKKVKNSRS